LAAVGIIRHSPGDPRLATAVAIASSSAYHVGEGSSDPLMSPRRVLGGRSHDQSGQVVADRRPTRRMGLAPFAGDQTAMPPQEGAGGDQPVDAQMPGQDPDERGQHCAVGQSKCGFGAVRRSTATSCGVPISASLAALLRARSASQASARQNIR